MTKGYFLRTKAVIRPSLLRNFEDLSKTCLGLVSEESRTRSDSSLTRTSSCSDGKNQFFFSVRSDLSVRADL